MWPRVASYGPPSAPSAVCRAAPATATWTTCALLRLLLSVVLPRLPPRGPPAPLLRLSAVCRAALLPPRGPPAPLLRPSSVFCCLCLPAATPSAPFLAPLAARAPRALRRRPFQRLRRRPAATPSGAILRRPSSRPWPREPLVHSDGALPRAPGRASPSCTPTAPFLAPLAARAPRALRRRPSSDSVSVLTARLGSCVRSLCRTL